MLELLIFVFLLIPLLVFVAWTSVKYPSITPYERYYPPAVLMVETRQKYCKSCCKLCCKHCQENLK